MVHSSIKKYWQHLFDNHDLNHFFFSMAIRWFGLSFLSIFIAGYLYSIGLSIRKIGLFFMIFYLMQMLSVPFSGKIVAEKGVKFSIIISTPLLLIYIISMPLLKNNNYLLPLIAVIGGMSASLFWVGYHLLFSSKADKKTRGEKISALVFISGLLMIIAPAIGGVLMAKTSFLIVALIASLIVIISFIPLSKVEEIKIPKNWTNTSLLRGLKTRMGIGCIAMGFVSIALSVYWPLFLFIILKGFIMLGIVSFLTGLFALLMNLLAGWLNDVMGEKKMLRISSFAESSLWIIRLIAASIPIIAVIIDALDKTTIKFFSLSFNARSYELASQNHSERILSREMGITMGAALASLIIIVIPSFYVSFTLAAIGSLWVSLM